MKISFQGVLGAYSHLAATQIYPGAACVGHETFFDAIESVQNGVVDCAVIPVYNSTAGPVQEARNAIAKSNLICVAEYDLRVRHQLWGLPEATIDDVKEAHSHPQALAQCVLFLKRQGITACPHMDTAAACRDVARWRDKTKAAIASELAGEMYGLKRLFENIEDMDNNTTHFVVLKR